MEKKKSPRAYLRLPDEELTPRQLKERNRSRACVASPKHNSKDPEFQRKARERMAAFQKMGNAAKKGLPKYWKRKDYDKYLATIRPVALDLLEKIIPHMTAEQTAILKDDDIAREAMVQTLMIMKNDTTRVETKLAAARTILEWTKQKPAQKNEHTVRRAEDFLQALADKETTGGPLIIEHQEEAVGQLPILRAGGADDTN
jgi:hypothetical protein